MFIEPDDFEKKLEPTNFFHKWSRRVITEFIKVLPKASSTRQSLAIPLAVPTLSMIIAKFVNLLDRPLFWGGILFLGWLLISPLLGLVLSPINYQAFIAPWQTLEPIIGAAVVGYWTNWLAIKMLFYPRKPNRIWQGIIPARRNTIIASIVSGITDNLFSARIVSDYLREHDYSTKLVDAIKITLKEEEFHNELQTVLTQQISVFLSEPEFQEIIRANLDKLITGWKAQSLLEVPLELSKNHWKPVVIEKIITLLSETPESLSSLVTHLDNRLTTLIQNADLQHGKVETLIIQSLEEGFHLFDIENIITTQLVKMDESQFEELLTGSVAAELTFIQTSGGLFGAMVGLVIRYPELRWFVLILAISSWIIYRKSVDQSSP